MKHIDQELNQLDSIQQVEVPPFLLTRIKAKIAAVGQQRIPLSWAWGLAATCVVLLSLNIMALQAQDTPTLDGTSELLEDMRFNPQNDIYYD